MNDLTVNTLLNLQEVIISHKITFFYCRKKILGQVQFFNIVFSIKACLFTLNLTHKFVKFNLPCTIITKDLNCI